MIIQSSSNFHKNFKDVFGIKNPVKHLQWSFLQKQFTVFSSMLIFDKVLTTTMNFDHFLYYAVKQIIKMWRLCVETMSFYEQITLVCVVMFIEYWVKIFVKKYLKFNTAHIYGRPLSKFWCNLWCKLNMCNVISKTWHLRVNTITK